MKRRSKKNSIVHRARIVPRGDGLLIIAKGRRRDGFGDSYVRLLAAPWRVVLWLIILCYLSANLLFAIAYLAIGNGIQGARTGSFADAYFFSVQTMATIGYGTMSPHGMAANILVTAEALIGFGFFAVVTGLVFSKFSRPTARVLFSNVAVICPYEGVPHLMIRLANERRNSIVDANIHLTMLRKETSSDGHTMRRFHDLSLVRSRVPLLRLTWTLMHRIDKESPLYQMTNESLAACEAEIIVSLVGLDETISQTIHARYSYISPEVKIDSVFEDILHLGEGGTLEVDYRKFHQVKPFKAPAK